MPVILVLTDFDGTLTGISGSAVVSSKFFRSLTEISVASPLFNYAQVKMKPAAEIDSLFVEEFGPYISRQTDAKGDRRFLMSDAVVSFMHDALSSHEVQIHIITLNRAEYVRAQFRYHGFTQTELDKIKISALLKKEFVVSQELAVFDLASISQVYVLDDTPGDFNAMRSAVITHGLETRLVAYSESPGAFDWAKYSQDIKATITNLKAPAAEQFQTVILSDSFFYNQSPGDDLDELPKDLLASLSINSGPG